MYVPRLLVKAYSLYLFHARAQYDNFSSRMIDKTPLSLPRHIGIIMDGNGRWAASRNLPRVAGHKEGAAAVNRIVTACRERGIRVLTLYAFSLQNWVRPAPEIKALMSLLGHYLKSERPTILDNDIRLTAIGDLDALPDSPRKALINLMDDSSDNTGMTLCLALSYGGREEIVAAARALAVRVASGDLDPAAIDADLFSESLQSHNLGPLDLLIRTSGELRISNFLLWSSAYCEFYFSDKMWPDFHPSDLDDALSSFSSRNRRFGGIGR
jgi:undecaprenyl diphosphate synthase